MKNLLLLSLIAGVGGTSIGGVMGAYLGGMSDKVLSNILSFAGGVMISIVCFSLVPETILLANVQTSFVGLVIGVLVVMLLNRIVDIITETSRNSLKAHTHLTELHHEEGLLRGKQLYKAGLIMLIAIALHNLPEGIAIGSGSAHDIKLGISLAVLLAIHNIPEGMAIAAPLRAGGMNITTIVLLTALSGSSTIVGSFIGFQLGSLSDFAIAMCFSVAGGAMLYVVLGEMLPQAIIMQKDRNPSIAAIFGFLAGLLFTMIS